MATVTARIPTSDTCLPAAPIAARQVARSDFPVIMATESAANTVIQLDEGWGVVHGPYQCWIADVPHSRRQMEFPEIDRAEFFDVATARQRIKAAQVPLIDELEEILSRRG